MGEGRRGESARRRCIEESEQSRPRFPASLAVTPTMVDVSPVFSLPSFLHPIPILQLHYLPKITEFLFIPGTLLHFLT